MELVDLKKYFDLLICSEQVYKINSLEEENLINRVREYFDNIIDSFNDLEVFINAFLSNNQVNKAKNIINDRFSDESLEDDLIHTTNEYIYLKVFNELKELFNLLIINYKNEEKKREYFDKITYVINSLHSSRKDAIYNLKRVNRSCFKIYINTLMNNVRRQIPSNLLGLFDNVEDLICLVSQSQVVIPDLAYLRNNIFLKFSNNVDFVPFGLVNNNLIDFIMDNVRSEKSVYFYDGVDYKNIYNYFCNQMIQFIDDNILSLSGRKYYKNMFSSNINKYLLLGNGCLTVNINNFFNFFNNILFAIIIDELTPDTETCYEKLNFNYFNKFKSTINDIKNFNFKENYFSSLFDIYNDELLSLKNDDLSVLKLFIKK